MTSRKTATVATAVIVGLGAAWVWGAASRANPEESSEVRQLQKRIEDLERRVERLERQRGGMAVVPPARPFGFNTPVPRDWKPGEFNGVPYYLIPLHGNRTAVDPNRSDPGGGDPSHAVQHRRP